MMTLAGHNSTPYSVYLPIAKAYDSQDGKSWIFEAPLSDPSKDLQNERMNMAGLRKGLKVFERLDMPVDWDHLWERTREPKWLIGKGLSLFDAPHPKTGEDVPFVRGVLFKSKEVARQAHEHWQACQDAGSGGLGISVAGSVIERDPLDKSHIIEPMVTSIALTPVPVVDQNAGTVQFFGKSLLEAEQSGLQGVTFPIISDLYSRLSPVFNVADADLRTTMLLKAMECTGDVPRSGPGANALETESLAGERRKSSKSDDEDEDEDNPHLKRADLGKSIKLAYDRGLAERLSQLMTMFPSLQAH